ncbi:N-acetylglucosamine-6-phosphate deacetylase [Collinsella sp. AGMB00827]|uniref:N-acetylglucosamine-6-phosphate deacetylase n=1 Tax=Collinsella ureilytica TaxID=2869515 RepID=A0ABS7MJN0_9ACTN|nr:N-acetylglucosamine-6-phosphate deacetylase [Collinsella urealyticum]MBY4797467.1 N-acetylglucosamine-6-phosphate deacetylase [Collinsella urealyticum]
MSTYAIAADTFYLPTGPVQGGYLMVENGVFGAHLTEKPDCEIVDKTGMEIAPGFVDTHIHGFHDHDVMDCDPAAVRAIARGLLENGVTSWLATTLTATTEQLEDACHAVALAAEQDGNASDENGGASAPGARIQGIFLEGPFFTEKHKGAQNPAYLCPPSLEKLERWQQAAKGLVKKIAIAPEYEESPAFTAAATAQGVVVALGHSDATIMDAYRCIAAGASVFVHTYNGMSPLHHREPGMVGAALTSKEAFAEIICDGHHVNPLAAKLVIDAKGYDHVTLITDCMRAGGMPDGDYHLGELPVIVGGGTARLKDGGSLAGSILRMHEAVQNIVAWGVASKPEAIYMATQAAAESAGIADVCGSIRVGHPADFVVLSKDAELHETYLGGACVYTA